MTGHPSADAPLRNRIDPWGDLHAVAARGLFTGNRGCVVDDHGNYVRHHGSSLWITCVLEFRGRRFGLTRPRRWTPLFFLDDAVALAAGHRPCAYCRRADYAAYRDAVAAAGGSPVSAADLNARLRAECLPAGRSARTAERTLEAECLTAGGARTAERTLPAEPQPPDRGARTTERTLGAEGRPSGRGARGMDRAVHRLRWTAPYGELPDGTVVVAGGEPHLLVGGQLRRFTFTGWVPSAERAAGDADVLTPPTSVAALAHGFVPVLHPSAG